MARCPNFEDYTPCTCDYLPGFYERRIYCTKVLESDDIRSLFEKRTPAVIQDLEMNFYRLNDSDVLLPEDFLGNHTFTNIMVLKAQESPYAYLGYRLIAHDNAFNLATKKSLKRLELIGFDMNGTDLRFLNGFHRLETFMANHITNIGLAKWETLLIPAAENGNEFANWFGFNLGNLYLNFDGMNDSTTKYILQVFLNISTNSLELLEISDNILTRIPEEIKWFKRIASISLMGGSSPTDLIGVITAGSLNFSHRTLHSQLWIDLSFNSISRIDPDAFEGKIIVITFLYS